MVSNRREFALRLASLTIGSGFGLLPGMVRASGSRRAGETFMLGIGSYTYRKLSPEEMINRLHSLQIDSIELSHPQTMLPRASVNDFRPLAVLFSKAKIQVRSWFCSTVKNADDIQKVREVSEILGVRHLSGDASGDILRTMDATLQKNSLYFGIHNHFFKGRRYEYESPEDLLKALSETSDHVGVTLDTGHMVSCGHDPIEAFQKLKQRVQVIHLKDVEGAGSDKNVPFGTGKGKPGEFVMMLSREKFKGLVAIEYEEGDDPQVDVEKCVKFVRSRV